MNTKTTDETSRPFGFWLKAVDRLMAAEFASAFESEGITRREWRLLNVVDGTVPAAHAKSDRPLPSYKLARLIERGWVTDADGTWTLTDEGRTAKERLGGIVDGIRAKVTDAVPADDLATTMSTLEQLARTFGWDEETPLPRGRGRRGFGAGGFGPRDFGRGHFGRGDFGRGRDHGFGPRSFSTNGFGPQHFDHEGYGAPEFDGREHCTHDDHGRRGEPRTHEGRGHQDRGRAHFARFVQGSYERGFDAGFARGRDAQ
ncbi:MarR family winged helix-turn-helix transcriptional regulator [Microbacterium sp. TWP3-1-2b2]|uniref:MarR family winged helix-turn-helix transcriptional regulator n=1 Tax=Microbacterium sp. TWP3-1-2b2 TaxID=2804651 RepID=UPI003CEC6195